MRLSTCVALELLVGATLVSGLGVSLTFGVQEVRAKWYREARAAEASRSLLSEQLPASLAATDTTALVVPEVDTSAKVETGLEAGVLGSQITARGTEKGAIRAKIIDTMPRSEVALVESPVHPGTDGTDYYGTFHGKPDGELLAPLRDAGIKKVKFNRGGSSVSLRIDFDNGARAAFKPVQKAPQTVPRREIAAYRINRLLGLSAVPPAIGRSFRFDDILSKIQNDSQVFVPRLEEEVRVKKGMVHGELSWWIPVIYKARVQKYEIDTTDGIVTWKRYLSVGKDMPEEDVIMLAQISSMVLFDFIINNPDRWSGANARVSKDRIKLYFMDNTMSFGDDPDGHRKSRIYLKRSQKFSKSLVHALRTLEASDVRAVIAHDRGPFEYLLADSEVEALMKRRDYALDYIDGLIAEHGEEAVLVFP